MARPAALAGSRRSSSWRCSLLAGRAQRGRGRRAAAAAALAGALSFAASPARSQLGVETEYTLERLRLATDREGILDVEWAGVLPHLDYDLAAYLGYMDAPLNLYMVDASGDRQRVGSLVSERLGGTLVAAVGLFDRAQLAVAVPVILSQNQDLSAFGMFGNSLASSGLGDVNVIPKLAVLRQRDAHVDVGVSLGFSLPTATEEDFFGEQAGTFYPELLVARGFESGLRLALNAGYRFRKANQTVDLVVDDEVFAHVGVGYRFASLYQIPLEVDLTFAVATAADDLFGSRNQNYGEFKGGAVYEILRELSLFAAGGVGVMDGFGVPDWRVFGGLRWRGVGAGPDADPVEEMPALADSDGDGIPDGEDRCPAQPETMNQFEDEDGCPDELPDRDRDGIADMVDRCPDEPEDFDSFQDDDGCPDLDNDGDTVADLQDRCVNEPGPASNFGCPIQDRDGDGIADHLDNCPDEAGTPENHGCKDRQLVAIKENRIELTQTVFFATRKAKIQRRSFALLDNVAMVLLRHPEIRKVRVEGHTDDKGADEFNRNLSQSRAGAVVQYLVQKGVPADRLEPVGYGESRPVAGNDTEKGRAANRRVEFVIVEPGS